MKGNVCYQKTDFGSETPDLLNKYVLKITQIAGIMLKNDISAEDLRAALNVPSKVSELENDEDFTTVSALNEEIKQRKATDKNLAALTDDLTVEIAARENGDIVLQDNIDSEQQAREDDVNAIMEYITELRALAHSHDNKSVLDGITEARVTLWDKISELDNQLEFADYKKDVLAMHTDNRRKLAEIYNMLGYTVIDGGLLGMGEPVMIVNGNAFEESEAPVIYNCGTFESRKMHITQSVLLNGGTY